MKPSKRILFILTAFVLGVAGYFYFLAPEELTVIDINNTESTTLAHPSSSIESLNGSSMELTSNTSKNCPVNTEQEINKMALEQWQTFKEDIYLQGMRYPVLQLAIARIEPLRGQWVLQQQPSLDKIPYRSKKPHNISEEQQKNILGTLLSEGIEGVVLKVEDNEFPVEVLSGSGSGFGTDLIGVAISFSQITNNTSLLPSKEEILSLVSYGIEITFDHYLQATKANATPSFLETIIALGPSPEASNYQHKEIPLDIAAKKSNFELMTFWLEQGLMHNNRLHGGDFSDSLLLQASSSQQLQTSWQFLQYWNKFPRDPATAKRLLSKKYLSPAEDLKLELEKLAKEKHSRISLSPEDQQLLQQALEKISKINQNIQFELDKISHCIKKMPGDSQQKNQTVDWIRGQLDLGTRVEDILLELSKISADEVDLFRMQREMGAFEPDLSPIGSKPLDFLDETVVKAFALAMMEDWKALSILTEKGLMNNAGILEMITDRSLKLPEEIKTTLKQQINSIDPMRFKKAVQVLGLEKIKNMQLDLETLNQTDPTGKNLFYYAVENNNTEMMQWLFEQQINIDPDPYGSDPMDMALKWNTHPETIEMLCSLGFPIKEKHRERFMTIQNNDAKEATEILTNCPEFGY